MSQNPGGERGKQRIFLVRPKFLKVSDKFLRNLQKKLSEARQIKLSEARQTPAEQLAFQGRISGLKF